MKEHHLKTLPQFWESVEKGEKTFEARQNDRDFKTGDELHLYRYEESALPKNFDFERHKHKLTKLVFRAGMVLYGPGYGVADGYAIISLMPINPEKPK
jgi:hypothetical protein